MAGKMVEKKIRSALPLYIAAGAFLVCAAVLPVYSLPGFLGACAVAAGAYFLSDKKIPPNSRCIPGHTAKKKILPKPGRTPKGAPHKNTVTGKKPREPSG